ncbi:MAG: esterase-like activity of phytase family protein [Erythrobacter sp.]
MTWRIAFATLALLAAPLAAQDDIFAITQPVALDETNPDTEEVGKLIYRGGVVIAQGEEEIGGISGLEWHEDRLYAVSDDGHWLTIEPDEFDGRVIDVLGLVRGELKDERGRRLRGKDDADAEAITRDASSGDWLVSFERDHRIWRYADIDGDASIELGGPIEGLTYGEANAGVETLASSSDGAIACIEAHVPSVSNCVRMSGGAFTPFEVAAPAGLAEHRGAPTDATCASDGTCYILFRSYRPGEGNRAAILSLSPDNETETLAVLIPPLTLDNFEGLALREQFGKRYLYVVSDNNFSDSQRTLLMKFEIGNDEPPVAQVPDPVVEYETVDVVLQTEMGDITVRLETERAPITAANFLRYVDEDRFDGTVFYRAMRLDREPRPNGLIQGGTQFDPERILPGIPHEPTTVTGLSHTNGALSMAMLEPGSANGDFSIMLQDQTGLDAQPNSPDPIWKNGYAVFGYVIAGMDVVSAIHAAPADPDKGEGVMRGQILADPVKIIDAWRIGPAAE